MRRVARGMGVLLLSTAMIGITAGVASAQASHGFFTTVCTFSHRLADDPIVRPGEPGASHDHDFFGNTSTTADSTLESLLAASTTCHRAADTAGYWTPALLVDGVLVTPLNTQEYWVSRVSGPVQAPPAGLKIVAGDAAATSPQQKSVVHWHCGSGSGTRSSSPPLCGSKEKLRLQVLFPGCWDGVNLDSADHRSHMTYSVASACPDTHPVAVATLRLTVTYPTRGGPGVTLSSGSALTGHADFFNAWQQAELERLVETCINAGVACSRRG